jgi:RNA polymerase sigma-70 factor (ECF subfamily)
MEYNTEKIWEDFSEKLRSFIAYKVSDPSHIDDILQDIFVKIHRNIDTLEDSSKIRSWVYRIAGNTIIDYYRKRKNGMSGIDSIDAQEEDALLAFDEIDGEDPAKEVASGLKGMIEALPEKYSQALFLVEFEGLSQVELAKKLNISVSGAKSRVQRGRLMLRDSLMKCCHFEFDRFGTIIGIKPACCCCCPRD